MREGIFSGTTADCLIFQKCSTVCYVILLKLTLYIKTNVSRPHVSLPIVGVTVKAHTVVFFLYDETERMTTDRRFGDYLS